jgi:hypothetical protein
VAFEQIAGKKDILVGKLQERYGRAKDKAEKDVDDFYCGMDAQAAPAADPQYVAAK